MVGNFTTQQKALLHSRQLHCIAESFTTRQTVLLNDRKFYRTAEKSILRQKLEKSSFCGRNINPSTETSSGRNKKVNLVAEIGEKFLLRQKQRISPLCSFFPWTWTQHLRISQTKLSCSWTDLNSFTQKIWA